MTIDGLATKDQGLTTRARDHGGSAAKSRRFLREEHGDTLVEFGISVLTLVMMLFTVFEISMMMYTYVTLGDAAREGVRYAIVHGSDNSNCSGTGCSNDPTGANVVTIVNNTAGASFHNISAMNVTPSWPDGNAQAGSRVKVQVSYSYIPFIQIPWSFTPTMNLTAEGRIVY